jgi:hypothetical protein
MAWSPTPRSPHGRARYASSVYASVSKNTTQLKTNALRPTSPSHPWARSSAIMINPFCFLTHLHFFGLRPLPPTHCLQIRVYGLVPPTVVRSRTLLRLGSSRAFVCEGPDKVVRRFWWHRVERGDYEVSRSISPYFLRLTRPLCPSPWGCFGCCGGFFLQLYGAFEPVVCIGLFRKHHPPEQLAVGDNYATFYFRFLHRPLLVHALLALSLNRWLDSQDGPQ